jgi:thiamine pyrophosphokinase
MKFFKKMLCSKKKPQNNYRKRQKKGEVVGVDGGLKP